MKVIHLEQHEAE